ncbi:hypothetical protein NDU88_008960 [Pleurodeles waltl]|uniref:Uncharacterized protein n=1 Tax=Pleurodeles waltl TaxID=8319 RepID=A0AAV7NEL3_PLEWA|nr:hypothetical protein NDU88_008960 [Pleurodeles waltl]
MTAQGIGLDLPYAWGTTQDAARELQAIRQDGCRTPGEETEIPGRRQEEKRRRKRTRKREEKEGTHSVVTKEETQDGEPKEHRTEDGRCRTPRRKLHRDDREGERSMQKPATFQEERGPTKYVNRTGEGDVISSGEGKEVHGNGENSFGTA